MVLNQTALCFLCLCAIENTKRFRSFLIRFELNIQLLICMNCRVLLLFIEGLLVESLLYAQNPENFSG